MKLLLDQNLSRKLVPILQDVYPRSSHVFLLGLQKATDSEIWHYARHHGFSLATKNKDMIDLCVLRGAPPKALWLRLGNCSTTLVVDVFARNRERIGQFVHDESRVVLSLFRLTTVE